MTQHGASGTADSWCGGLLSRTLAAWGAAVEWTAMKRTRLAACRRRLEAAASRRALLSWHCSAKAAAQVLAMVATMRIS